MNTQRKVVITTTYNEMGIIIDTKAEEVAQPNLQPTCNQLATDTINRQAAIDALRAMQTYKMFAGDDLLLIDQAGAQTELMMLPSAQPEEIALHESCTNCPLYDKDRHKCPRFNKVIPEALRELQPAQPETAKRIVGKSRDSMTLWYQCDMCNEPVDAQDNFCRGCGRRLIDEID